MHYNTCLLAIGYITNVSGVHAKWNLDIPVSILPLRAKRRPEKETESPAKHTSTSLEPIVTQFQHVSVIIAIWSHSEGSDGGESYRERTYAPWSEPLEQKLALN